jgi:hypothetical protein
MDRDAIPQRNPNQTYPRLEQTQAVIGSLKLKTGAAQQAVAPAKTPGTASVGRTVDCTAFCR